MAGNWMDDREPREQGWQARDYRRDEGSGQREGRSFGRDDRYDRPDMYAARRSGPDRDRVFGERESGGDYTGSSGPAGGYKGRGAQGAAPRFGAQDYTRDGARFYGDDSRERVYREEYGQPSRGSDSAYSPSRAGYHRSGFDDPGFDDYGHDDKGRPLSGGTGGYDYERGYGDGGREDRGQRMEDAGRKSGEFLHKAGQKVASWFAAAGDTAGFDQPGRDFYGEDRGRDDRGHRGRGPKAYKRSDERIAEDANERLTEDRWLDASDIDVKVSGGELTLSGTVENREAKHRAERIVEELSGVNHVQNNLRVAERGGAGQGGAAQDRSSSVTGEGTPQGQVYGDAAASDGGVGTGPIGSTGRKN